jgi:hypothetical protein
MKSQVCLNRFRVLRLARNPGVNIYISTPFLLPVTFSSLNLEKGVQYNLKSIMDVQECMCMVHS